MIFFGRAAGSAADLRRAAQELPNLAREAEDAALRIASSREEVECQVETLERDTLPAVEPALLAASPDAVRGYDDLRRAAESWQTLWQAVRQGEDHGYVAGTFHFYRLEPHPP